VISIGDIFKFLLAHEDAYKGPNKKEERAKLEEEAKKESEKRKEKKELEKEEKLLKKHVAAALESSEDGSDSD
jgi:hypothetical protein